MPLPTNFTPTQLTITYVQPLANNSVNVTVTSVNVNVAALQVSANDFVQNVMLRGYWAGLTFIPARQITLITAS